MTKYSKESLEKLLVLIDEICKEDEYLWFKDDLLKKNAVSKANSENHDRSISKIYEFCIRDIINKQANKFYEDFKLEEIKPKLIEDFIRMEHFRREDNFEDFCLAMFQQLENIVVYIFNSYNLAQKISEDGNLRAISTYNSERKIFERSNRGIFLGNLIFQNFKGDTPLVTVGKEYYFNNKFRAVIYYLYFKQVIEFNTSKFEEVYSVGNSLYQMRNLNHRGGEKSEYQQKLLDEIIPNHNKYYFKFLGFLESFISNINQNL